jgi:branched-chain amino acid aminotransferase
MPTRVNIGGRLLPPERALISVFDRGFLYGDSVYEVLRTYGGAPFALADHLRRLNRSAELIGMEIRHSDAWLVRELARTLRTAQNRDAYIRIVATRGAGPIGLDPSLARDPQILFIVKPLEVPPPSLYRRGARVELVPVGQALPARVDPEAKSGNYLANILALRDAKARGAYEAVMLAPDGRVREGSSSNIFIARGGRVYTPPLSAGILEGITRGRILRLGRELGITIREANLEPRHFARADEAFLTSSIREVMPVTMVGHASFGARRIGNGRVGALTGRLREAFRERARREAAEEWAALRKRR